MKHTKLFKNITLGVACLLGAGVAAGVCHYLNNSNDSFKEVKAINVSNVTELKNALASATSSTEVIVQDYITITPNDLSSLSYVLDGKGATVRVPTTYLNEDMNYNSNPSSFGVFKIDGSGHSMTFKNMTIMGGYSESGKKLSNQEWYSAVNVTSGEVVQFENCNFTRSCGGIGLLNSNGNAKVIVKNSNFYKNVSCSGGAIRACSGTLLVDGCSFVSNASNSWSGGAIALDLNANEDRYTNAYINNSVFANNTSGSATDGGGIFKKEKCKLYIMNSTITGNATTRYSYDPSDENFYGGGVGLQDAGGGEATFFSVNNVIEDNYITNYGNGQQQADRDDISQTSYQNNPLNMYNTLYGSLYESPEATGNVVSNCKEITDKTFGSGYLYFGNARKAGSSGSDNKYTSKFYHPIITQNGNNPYSYYVAANRFGPAATGGVKTYIDYSDFPTVKMGYGEASSINALGTLAAPSSDKKVTKYFEGTTRVDGVIGASALAPKNYYFIEKGNISNGSMTGIPDEGELYIEGTQLTLTATPNEGYGFKYWTISNSEDHPTDNPYLFTPTGSAIVTPVFGKIYSVSYNLNGGTGTTPTAEQCISGNSITAASSTDFSREGYSFTCWNTKANGTGTNVNAGASYTVTANTTLYAKWSANQYTVTLDDNGGEGGSGSVNVTYNANIPAVSVPTKTDNQFTGYYDDPDEGTQYIKADGTSARTWNIASNTILYAHYGLPIEASSTGYQAAYDGQAHSISINVTVPEEGYTIMYRNGTSGDYNLTSIPTYTNVGSYTTGYKISKDGYSNFYGSNTVVISKAPGTYVEPTAIEGLYYTGAKQTLINAGSTSHGSVRYRLGTSGSFVTTLPQATDVGSYDVYYKLVGDANHSDSEVKYLTVTISAANKDALKNALDEANAFYNAYNPSYPDPLTSLKAVIDSAQTVYDDPNPTTSQVESAIHDLKDMLNDVRVDIVKDKINNLGTITYPDSKAKLDEARGLYDSIIDEKKPLVDNYKTLVDAETLYAQLELNATRHELDDDESGVKIETKDGIGIPKNIDLRVEVRTDVKAEEGSVAREKIESMLNGKEKISGVYDVKLIQTIEGVETEVQPSDIETGLKIVVHITLPEEIDAETLKILHIHSEDDMEYLSDFKIENGELIFEVDRFSEFAFVVPAPSAGLPGWAIALIVIGSLLLLCCIFLLFLFIFSPRYIVDYSKRQVIRCIYVKKHYDMVLLLDTHLRKVRRHEVDVYKSREEAEAALKK